MKHLKEKFGMRIKEIRRSKNMTQERLAEIIGIDTPNLSNIERGKRFVTSETLEKIANALEVQEKELFDFNHLETRDEIIKQINRFINNATDKELAHLYRLINTYNGFQIF